MDTIRKILRQPLFRISSLNGLSVLVKIAIGLVTSKVIAVFVGPAGMALVGNLRNFITSAESICTLGFQNGIVKYIAENENNKQELKRIITTVFLALLVVAVVLSGLLFFLSGYWNEMVFGNNFNYATVFRVMALALPWYAVSLFLISVINGLGKFRQVIYINMIGNAVGLLVSVGLIWHYHTLGALLSVVIAPALLFVIAFYFISRELDFARTILLPLFDWKIIRNLSSYSLMALVSAVLGPLVMLSIRKKVIVVTGIEAAGHWEAMLRISTYYLMFVSTLLTVYFLPKLAVAKDTSETKTVFRSYFKGVMPVFIAALVVIYFLREYILPILFTHDFLPVSKLFFWQLTGDVFKAASMVLGFQFFAKKMTTAFIITEIFSLSVLYCSSLFFVAVAGIEGIVMAHALTYFIYLIVLSVYFRKSLF